ncbi:DNA mismatch repair protein MutT [Bacillus solimangrovi]|uniref:DNA mismatch repair protein MutT n=2 Tax=Bacillus solimangrovi TaxID=1305675 RepID=A0A1E5LE57_9BACI|nr:NUDIX domain-containing protein [Bacillus solimangrovi]OEH92356.1 DNA mismatch repair protein MutT [Bacillus solimangrovi]
MTQNGIVLVVCVSIIQDGKFLLIKENKRVAKNMWNFPSGRIEIGEDIFEAAHREVKEETGFEVKLTNTTGVYNFISSTDDQVILFHFIGELAGGSLTVDGEEIIDYAWVKITDFSKFDNQELRNANVLNQIVDNIIEEKYFDINAFHKQLK